MRVVADLARCEGNAVCVGLAPEVFDLNDEDYVVIQDPTVPTHLQPAVNQAIAECPRAALTRHG
jgi:ferredoxin